MRSRSMIVLLVDIWLFHLGYYGALPYLPIALSRRGLGVAGAGAVLAAQAFMFQAASFVGGLLGGKISRRALIAGGGLLRGAGLALFALVPSDPAGVSIAAYGAAIVSGIGGGFLSPTTKAGIAALAGAETGSTAFSLRGIAANLGVTIGPLIAAWLSGGGLGRVFLFAGVAHAILSLVTAIWLGRDCESAACPTVTRNAFGHIWHDLPFLVFTGASLVMWMVYAQFAFGMPLRVEAVTGSARQVGFIWTFTSLEVILLQLIVTRKLISRLHPVTALAVGAVLLGTGLGSLALAGSLPALVVSGLVFTLGEMFFLPVADAITAQLAKPAVLTAYFGIAAVVLGLGESLGNFLGGQLVGRFGARSPWPWLIQLAAALVVAGVWLWLRRWPPMRQTLRQASTASRAVMPHAAAEGAEPVPAVCRTPAGKLESDRVPLGVPDRDRRPD